MNTNKPVGWAWRFADGRLSPMFATRKDCASLHIGYEGQPVPLVVMEEGQAQEPVAMPPFNTWSTDDGDSWFDHPADAQAIYDVLGDDPKVGDEFTILAGWKSVDARYRVTAVSGDGECEVECISHPEPKSQPSRPAPRQPLPFERIQEMLLEHYYYRNSAQRRSDFISGVRCAEAAHGIGVPQATHLPADDTEGGAA